MTKFYITREERRRAQDRAAELDVEKTDPPGRRPYVWDNRLNCVKRWYAYGSEDEKVGTVYFEPVVRVGGGSSPAVECTTEITHYPGGPEWRLRQEVITDKKEHRKLLEFFFRDLLDTAPQ